MTSPKTMRALLFSLFALAAISMVVFVFLPRQQAISRLRDELRARRQYIDESQHLDALIVNMENELQEARSYVARCAGSTPPDAELVSVFGKIARAATDCGVVTQSFQPERACSEPAPIKRLTATLVTEGPFRQTFAFLARLEHLPFLVWLDDLGLRMADDETGHLSCQVKLVIFADNCGNSD